MNRRTLLTAGPMAAAALVLPVAAQVDKGAQLEALRSISNRIGLSIDDVHDWLDGVDMTIVAANVGRWEPKTTWKPSQTHAAFMSYAADSMTADESPLRGFMEAQLLAKGDKATIRRAITNFAPGSYPQMARLRAEAALA